MTGAHQDMQPMYTNAEDLTTTEDHGRDHLEPADMGINLNTEEEVVEDQIPGSERRGRIVNVFGSSRNGDRPRPRPRPFRHMDTSLELDLEVEVDRPRPYRPRDTSLDLEMEVEVDLDTKKTKLLELVIALFDFLLSD